MLFPGVLGYGSPSPIVVCPFSSNILHFRAFWAGPVRIEARGMGFLRRRAAGRSPAAIGLSRRGNCICGQGCPYPRSGYPWISGGTPAYVDKGPLRCRAAGRSPDAVGSPGGISVYTDIWDILSGVFFLGYPFWDILSGISFRGYPFGDILSGISFRGYPFKDILSRISFRGYPFGDIIWLISL